MSAGPILIMAGGTGGHVFPALTVARALRKRNQTVVWLGTSSGLEARVVPAEGITLDRIRVSYLRGGKRRETEVDVSAARRNFLAQKEDRVNED